MQFKQLSRIVEVQEEWQPLIWLQAPVTRTSHMLCDDQKRRNENGKDNMAFDDILTLSLFCNKVCDEFLPLQASISRSGVWAWISDET